MIVDTVSDLHLEFSPVLRTLPGGDVLLLCGDTFVARRFDRRNANFLKGVSARYDRILALMGNHEHYDGVIDDTPALMRSILAAYAPNARLFDNEVEVIGGVAFIGSTLWAPCRKSNNPMVELGIGSLVSDFRRIATLTGNGDETRRLTTVDVRARHEASVAWLADTIPRHGCAVVMTHHAPSLLSRTKYEANGMMAWPMLVPAYCSDQEALIRANPGISHWVHGHTHQPARYVVGSTLVLSNQHGYPHEAIARDFDPALGRFEVSQRAGCKVA